MMSRPQSPVPKASFTTQTQNNALVPAYRPQIPQKPLPPVEMKLPVYAPPVTPPAPQQIMAPMPAQAPFSAESKQTLGGVGLWCLGVAAVSALFLTFLCLSKDDDADKPKPSKSADKPSSLNKTVYPRQVTPLEEKLVDRMFEDLVHPNPELAQKAYERLLQLGVSKNTLQKITEQKQKRVLTTLTQEPQQGKTLVDSSAVVKSQSGSTDREDEALKGFKQELVLKMINGLASAMPEIRTNARQALSKLGVSESKLDQLRLELEKEEYLGQSSVQFKARVRDEVMANNSFDAVVSQVVNYQVSNVTDYLVPTLSEYC